MATAVEDGMSDPSSNWLTPARPHERARIGGWGFLISSVFLFLFAIGSGALTARFLSEAEQGIAEVVEVRQSTMRSRGWVMTLSVITQDGRRITDRLGGEVPLRTGEAIRVVYRRGPIPEIRPYTPSGVWGWTIAFGLGGAVLACLGAVFLGVSRFLQPPSTPP